MHKVTLLLALALTWAAPITLVHAEDEDHSAHHPSQEATENPPAGAEHDHGDAKADPAQDSMKRIEAIMLQIQEITDIDLKRTLLAQHLQALRDQVRLIRSKSSGMKTAMKSGAKAGREKQEGEPMGGMMKPGGMMMMHKKVEQRIDMFERLLQQMLERAAVEESMEGH